MEMQTNQHWNCNLQFQWYWEKYKLDSKLGHNKVVPKRRNRDDSNFFWLRSRLNENSQYFRAKHLHPMFVKACRDAGFLVIASYRIQFEKILFSWNRSKLHNEEANIKSVRKLRGDSPEGTNTFKQKTVRPIKGGQNQVQCVFCFYLHWAEESLRWFLPRLQGGNIKHTRHCHAHPNKIKLLRSTHACSTEELQLASESFKSKISVSATSYLLKTRCGEQLDHYQVQFLKTKQRKEELVLIGAHGASSQTNSDKPLAYLSTDTTKSFVMLFGEFNSGLLTSCMKRMTVNNELKLDEFIDKSGDMVGYPWKYAESMRAKLQMSNGKILVGCAWTTDIARRQFGMYPEVIGCDATEETNSEERPLYIGVGLDNKNKAYEVMWAFLPSKAQWTYSWLWKHALPLLHPGTATHWVHGIICNADPQETRAIESFVKQARVIVPFSNTQYAWWEFHRLNRNFTHNPKYKYMLAQVKNINILSRIEIDVVTRWLCFFVK